MTLISESSNSKPVIVETTCDDFYSTDGAYSKFNWQIFYFYIFEKFNHINVLTFLFLIYL